MGSSNTMFSDKMYDGKMSLHDSGRISHQFVDIRLNKLMSNYSSYHILYFNADLRRKFVIHLNCTCIWRLVFYYLRILHRWSTILPAQSISRSMFKYSAKWIYFCTKRFSFDLAGAWLSLLHKHCSAILTSIPFARPQYHSTIKVFVLFASNEINLA